MTHLDFSQPPFDFLTPAERESLKKHSQVRYLGKGEVLLEADTNFFYVVIKGHVQQKIGDTYVGDFHATSFSNDWFDARKLPEDDHISADMIGSGEDTSAASPAADIKYQYIALEDALLLQIEADAIDRISAQNHHIRNLLSGELTERMQALSGRKQPSRPSTSSSSNGATQRQAEAQQLMLQPVTEVNLLKVHSVDDTATLFDAAHTMSNAGLKHVLVKRTTEHDAAHSGIHTDNLGIITDTDICRAVSERIDLDNILCRDYAHFKLRTIPHDHDISEALLTMNRYRIHRLPVLDDNGEVIGILGQSDLLSFLSHHSHLITVQIDEATSVDMIGEAVEQIGQYIRAQHDNGIKIGVISRMVQTLNAHVFTKLWHLIVPDEVYKNTCIIVMGSEGRGEQIMRTDQDNALILRDGFDHPKLADYADEFNQTLGKLGYPLCDGNIMMTNPIWRLPISEFKAQVSSWFANPEGDKAIWLSAVIDSDYVCGDEQLFNQLREHLAVAHKSADPMFLRSFVRAALQFGDVNQWWQKFAPLIGKPAEQDIDLKKAGIFPIVHGVRAMALEHDIFESSSTKARLRELARLGVMSENRANTINETLEFFLARRLDVALTTDDKFARQVDPTTLSALERDLLKECLNVVKSFKNQLSSHYQLDLA